jgi:hypothetical protein
MAVVRINGVLQTPKPRRGRPTLWQIAQRRLRRREGLKIQIFDPATTWLRLDRQGRPLPCSRCGGATMESALETFCAACILEMAAAVPKRRGEYAPAPTQSPICVRCREPLGDEDDCWRCESCLLAVEREESGVQPSLNFSHPPARSRESRHRLGSVVI